MKVVFVNLPTPFLENPKWVYPSGILALATWARDELGHEVEVLDLADASDEVFDASLLAAQADALAVSAVTPQAGYLGRVPLLRPDVRLIAGGIHPTLFPQEAIQAGYDVVVQGEGELVLGEALTGPLGVISTPVRADLDTLPRIDRTLISGYHGPVPVMAGRGCPFTCAFCAQTDRKIREARPISSAVDAPAADAAHLARLAAEGGVNAWVPWVAVAGAILFIAVILLAFGWIWNAIPPLRELWLNRTLISDLGPLAGSPLVSLTIEGTRVRDLEVIRRLPLLQRLHLAETPVEDLSPVAGLPLTRLVFTPKNIKSGIDAARGLQRCQQFGIRYDGAEDLLPPAQFWAAYDAGQLR